MSVRRVSEHDSLSEVVRVAVSIGKSPNYFDAIVLALEEASMSLGRLFFTPQADSFSTAVFHLYPELIFSTQSTGVDMVLSIVLTTSE